ncbi:MAG: DUF3667 domain-containing protein [Betaproteobacteria bacterium]|nr:DUF3667 domain-containing protein [Betaproteobacteria bacterium]
MSEAVAATTHCRNCDAFLGDPPGNFCPQCGQDTANHAPSFWEFCHEFITHYVALEGKLWRTMVLLFFKPAELTREYRIGRKQRYISPLRLYITASFIFFLVIKVAGWGNTVYVETTVTHEPDKSTGGKHFTVKTVKPAGELSLDDLAVGQMTAKDVSGEPSGLSCKPGDVTCAKVQEKLDSAGKKVALAVDQMTAKDVSGEPSGLSCKPEDAACVKQREKLAGTDKKVSELTLDDLKAQGKSDLKCDVNATVCNFLVVHLEKKYKGKNLKDVMEMMKAGMLADIPYALFLLLPLFALMTKLIYLNRGLYFGEHVVYALHVHSFTFFILLLKAMLPRAAGEVVLIAAFVYYFIAMQRFFGGRWWATTLRYGLVGFAYPVLLSLVASAVAMFVFIA